MRRGLLLTALLAAPAVGQQYTAEPQYQLTGKNYSSEAPAIQQMFYNTTSGIQHLQSEINAIVVPASGVTKIVAGTNVTISPAGGTGNVTVNASGGATVGISSNCAAGFYLSTGTWVNGVTTGGGCVAIPTTLPPNGSAGGSLTGTYPNPTLLNPGLSTGAVVSSPLTGNGNINSPITTVGISSSCAAGFYLSTGTWVKGVQTGGGCVAVPTSLPPSGAAGGALTGTYPNPTLLNPGVSTGVVTNVSMTGNGNVGSPLSTVGVTSSCATGFYWDTFVSSNGLTVGGKCLVLPSSSGGGSSSMTITAVSDDFLGSVTGSQKVFTLSQTPANAAALTCVLDGLHLSQTSDYTYAAPTTITVTTAPAANSTGFFCNYFVNTSTLPGVAILSQYNQFTSSISIGPTVYSTTVSYASVIKGAYSVVLYSSFTAASTVYLTGFSSAAYHYRIHLDGLKNTDGEIKLTINSDTGSKYYWSGLGLTSDGRTQGASAAASAYYRMFNCLGAGPNVAGTTSFDGNWEMTAQPSLNNLIKLHGLVNALYATPEPDGGGDMWPDCASGVTYNGSAPMTTMTISNSAGTITGWLTIEALVPAVWP